MISLSPKTNRESLMGDSPFVYRYYFIIIKESRWRNDVYKYALTSILTWTKPLRSDQDYWTHLWLWLLPLLGYNLSILFASVYIFLEYVPCLLHFLCLGVSELVICYIFNMILTADTLAVMNLLRLNQQFTSTSTKCFRVRKGSFTLLYCQIIAIADVYGLQRV